MNDPFIIISGGLVSNSPSLPVLDLDILTSEAPDQFTYEEVGTLRDQAAKLHSDLSMFLRVDDARTEQLRSLTDVVAACDDWMTNHRELEPS